jgi:hypothetical protein
MNRIRFAAGRRKGLPFYSLFCLLMTAAMQGQSLPEDLRSVLTSRFRFTGNELKGAEAGRPVAKLLSGRRPDDLQLIGLVPTPF